MTEDEVIPSLQPQDDQVVPVPSLEDPAPQAGAVPVPAQPGAQIVPPPDYGPPAPSPTDSIAANLPPVPGGIPTQDPSKMWPPPVPAGAPGAVAAPPALNPNGPAGPQDAPGQPGDDIQAGLDQTKADREATNAALLKEHEAAAEQTHAAAEEATKRRQLAEETAKREQQAQAQYDAAEKQAQADTAQTREALKNFKFRDLWSSKSTVQKIGSGISVALLAIGAGLMKTPKYAIDVLQKEKDDDYKKQLDHLAQLKDDDVMARTGLTDVRAARARAMADITMGSAQSDRVIASQFEEAAARAKDQNSGNEAMSYAAKLKQDADEKDMKAHVELRNFRLQDQANLLAKQEKEAHIAELNAQATALNAHAAGTGGYAKKGKGAGTGIGGKPADIAGFTAAIADAKKKGQQLDYPAMVALAGQFNVPAEAKAGHPSIKTVLAGMGQVQGQGIKGEGMDLKEDKQLELKVKTFAAEHQLPKLEAASRKLEEVRSMLDSNNPVAAMSALMEYDAAAKGSSATESSMHAIQSHLGGSWDRLKGMIENKQTGGFGEDQTKILRGAIDAGRKAFKESVEPIHQAFYEKLDGSKPEVKNAAAGLFRPFGYNEKGAPEGGGSAPQGKRVKLKDGRTGTLTGDGMFHQDQ